MFKKLALTFFFLVGVFVFSLNSVSAQDMVPKPNTTPFPELRYPCGGTSKEADYHSLRPFQAAPCGEANKAEYCSNELKFIESFDLTSYCTPQYQTGDFTCYPNFKVDPHDLYVSLDQSELPILGNTEDVTNSRTHDDIFDDARKVNEYASWYLSGVNVRAEYGEADADKVVNYSGPLQKLLPGAIADAQRTKVIDTYGAHHNQIAVCATGGIHPLGKWLSDILGLPTFGVEKPIECYTSDESKAQDHAYRLSEWKGSSALQDIISKGSHLLPTIFPGNILADVMGSMGDRWTLRTPPLPWSDKNGVPFATSQDYQKAYNEWRGQLCAFLPNPFSGDKYLVCLGAWPIISNPYADLFQYIPLAETVDKEGAERIDGVTIAGDGGTVVEAKPETWPKITPPLYFAHTEEVKQLSETLNKTYIPKDLVSVPLPETTEKNKCSVVNIRANPGDNLFPGDNDELQVQRVNYTITEVTCHEVYEVRYVEDENGRMRREIIHEFECPADVTIRIKTSTLTPNADEIFASTVADSTSTFRKIYPKVEAGAPVSCIADIPTVTNVTYDATKSEWPNGGTQTFGVDNYPEDGGNTTPQLTFPHIGSVYEYFLKGIQTALRPQGYADPNPISGNLCQTTSQANLGDICAVADAYGIPCCQLQGIAALETGSGAGVGSGSCSTKNGTFSCCNGGMCGPSQIACGQYNAFAGNDNIDMCDPVGSAELLARAMLLKLCQADGKCNSYDWNTWGDYVKQNYSVEDGDYTAAAYFYGLANGCTVTACSQYRWGAGKSYCDAVKSYCETGSILTSNTSKQFCEKCNEEIIRAGQTPINCN